MGMVKHRRTRLSTDGMTTRIRSFKCSAARTCISGGPQANISGGEKTVKCKSADIHYAPESTFRRWQKKEKADFDREQIKDTPESAPFDTETKFLAYFNR